MIDIKTIDKYYNKFVNEVSSWVKDRIITVNLDLLKELDLLHYHSMTHHDSGLTTYFKLIESQEKITLIDERFIIWIAPKKTHDSLATYTFIALNRGDHPELELVFVASGAYNNSPLILRVLEKLLQEIQENEDFLNRIENKQK